MTKYLHYFEILSAYTEARQSAYIEPWVSYTEGRGVDYNMDEEEREQEYLHMPFTIEALASGNVTWQSLGSDTASYSVDDGETWETMTSATTIAVSAGDEVQVKRSQYSAASTPVTALKSSGNFNVKGNLMSLTHGDNFESAGAVTNPFNWMFSSCNTLISAEHLQLPATAITSSYAGYSGMFGSCANLLHGPKHLPATSLNPNGQTYQYMFSGCTNMVDGPREIAATVYGNYECGSMFANCSALTVAPVINALSAGAQACQGMFDGCASLVTAPEIPITAFTGQNPCASMFSNCTSLVNGPSILPAMTLTNACYNGMFAKCSSLVKAPALPATELQGYCYAAMFSGCTSLVNAPVLPATTGATIAASGYGYANLFQGCSSLGYIKMMMIEDFPYFEKWVQGVPNSGTFVMNSNAVWDPNRRGIYYVPEGWSVETASA